MLKGWGWESVGNFSNSELPILERLKVLPLTLQPWLNVSNTKMVLNN